MFTQRAYLKRYHGHIHARLKNKLGSIRICLNVEFSYRALHSGVMGGCASMKQATWGIMYSLEIGIKRFMRQSFSVIFQPLCLPEPFLHLALQMLASELEGRFSNLHNAPMQNWMQNNKFCMWLEVQVVARGQLQYPGPAAAACIEQSQQELCTFYNISSMLTPTAKILVRLFWPPTVPHTFWKWASYVAILLQNAEHLKPWQERLQNGTSNADKILDDPLNLQEGQQLKRSYKYALRWTRGEEGTWFAQQLVRIWPRSLIEISPTRLAPKAAKFWTRFIQGSSEVLKMLY